LVKFTVTPTGSAWLISAVDLSDLVALNVNYAIHCQVSSERHSQIVAEREKLAGLIVQIVDQLGVLTVLLTEDFLK
jgi:hypothetical protein